MRIRRSLTLNQSKLLCAAEFEAELSVAEMARRAGIKPHVAQHALSTLRKSGIASPLPLIDGYRLGFHEYGVLFSVHLAETQSRRAAIDAFLRFGRVTWFAELGGDYRFYAAINARSPFEAASILEELAARSKFSLIEKAVSVIIEVNIFRRKHLSQKSIKPGAIRFGEEPADLEIDEIDHKLLRGLMIEEYGSRRELASILKLPLSTLEYRIRRLVERKLIKAFVMRPASSLLGMHYIKLLVYVRGVNPEFNSEFLKFCSLHPNILYMHRSFGSWDYEVGVEVADQRESVVVSDAIFERFGAHINSLKILPVFTEYPIRSYPFAA